MQLTPSFIDIEESKYKNWIIQNGDKDCPIAMIGDAEFVFVHYRDKNKAYNKWMTRLERINYNNLIFKNSIQNHATADDIKAFDDLELPGKKIMFVNKPNMGYKYGVYYHGFEDQDEVSNDTYFGNRYFDIASFLNEGILPVWK